MRVVGIHDGSVGKLAMGRDILTDEHAFNLDQCPFVAGNAAMENVMVSGAKMDPGNACNLTIRLYPKPR